MSDKLLNLSDAERRSALLLPIQDAPRTFLKKMSGLFGACVSKLAAQFNLLPMDRSKHAVRVCPDITKRQAPQTRPADRQGKCEAKEVAG